MSLLSQPNGIFDILEGIPCQGLASHLDMALMALPIPSFAQDLSHEPLGQQ